MTRRLSATLPLALALCCSCSEGAPAPAPPPAEPPPAEAPAPEPPPEPVAVPLSDPPKPPPEPPPDDGREAIAAVRERLQTGLSSKRNRARLTRLLEAARRDDRPMVRRVLAEADARARAGAPDAMEWKTVMNRLEDHVNDDPEPVVGEAWDRIADERARVRAASAEQRDAMWQKKADEQARIDRTAGETFGTPGTRMKFNKPGEGEVTRRVYTDADGELALEKE
jgi:hypothetical protein